MTNTPDKSEMLLPCPFCGGTELYDDDQRVQCNDCFAESPVTAWNTRTSSRPPADQVPDMVRPVSEMVERVARAHSPEKWATIDELRSTAAWYRQKIGKVGYRDGSAEREAESNQRLADKYANEQITRARAAIAALQVVPAASGEEWQPIESAPKDGTPLLLAGQCVDHPSVAAFDGREWVGMVDGCAAVRYMSDFGTEYLTVDVPEFWRPLPAPPASGEE